MEIGFIIDTIFAGSSQAYYSKVGIKETIGLGKCLENTMDFYQSDFVIFTDALIQTFFLSISSQQATLISRILHYLSLIYLQDIDKILNPIFVIILIPQPASDGPLHHHPQLPPAAPALRRPAFLPASPSLPSRTRSQHLSQSTHAGQE